MPELTTCLICWGKEMYFLFPGMQKLKENRSGIYINSSTEHRRTPGGLGIICKSSVEKISRKAVYNIKREIRVKKEVKRKGRYRKRNEDIYNHFI